MRKRGALGLKRAVVAGVAAVTLLGGGAAFAADDPAATSIESQGTELPGAGLDKSLLLEEPEAPPITDEPTAVAPEDSTAEETPAASELVATEVEPAAAEPGVPVATSETQVALSYQAHVQGKGWLGAVGDGGPAGTTGQSRRMEALRVTLPGIQVRAHCQSYGWLGWVGSGQMAGTAGQSKRLEALQIKLTGDLADEYDLYYRVHVAGLGWLDWATAGQTAGTCGMSRAIEAVEIRLVPTGAAFETGPHAGCEDAWSLAFSQKGNTTGASVEGPGAWAASYAADTVEVRATLSYNGKVTRTATRAYKLASLKSAPAGFDFKYHGTHTVTLTYKKAGKAVRTVTTRFNVGASEFNMAWLHASFPVVQFTTSYPQVSVNAAGEQIPTVISAGRSKHLNWNSLMRGMEGNPFAASDATYDLAAYSAYLKHLYQANPQATFHIYINDVHLYHLRSLVYANNLSNDRYNVVMLSDGTGSYGYFNEVYADENASDKHAELVAAWGADARAVRASGNASGYGVEPRHKTAAAVFCYEPHIEWWLTRTDQFKSGDNNVLANTIASDSRIKKVNVGSNLAAIQAAGDDAVAEFKSALNFNDAYFAEAEKQNKQAMVILGSSAAAEKNLADYVRLTMAMYGDEYLYYYKGHPGHPVSARPDLQRTIAELGLIDVDSSIAAELILFFNPEISLSGYWSTTFDSATSEMAGGLFDKSKEEAVAENPSRASVMDWFATPLTAGDAVHGSLVTGSGSCYLVEFSDEHLVGKDYEFAVYSVADDVLTYYRTVDGAFERVSANRGLMGLRSALSLQGHVQTHGWMTSVLAGDTCGTVGQSKRLEAVKIQLTDSQLKTQGSIQYRVHAQGSGWLPWSANGKQAGTVGEGRRLEAVEIKLTGDLAKHYDVVYRAHVQDRGYLGWVQNGKTAGTTGESRRMEAIQVKLVPKA